MKDHKVLTIMRKLKQLLKNAKAKYVGSFIRRSENPSTIAGYALNIKLNNLDELRPGSDKGLDVICNGILGDTDFIYDDNF